jgi:hypothetical protein
VSVLPEPGTNFESSSQQGIFDYLLALDLETIYQASHSCTIHQRIEIINKIWKSIGMKEEIEINNDLAGI